MVYEYYTRVQSKIFVINDCNETQIFIFSSAPDNVLLIWCWIIDYDFHIIIMHIFNRTFLKLITTISVSECFRPIVVFQLFFIPQRFVFVIVTRKINWITLFTCQINRGLYEFAVSNDLLSCWYKTLYLTEHHKLGLVLIWLNSNKSFITELMDHWKMKHYNYCFWYIFLSA